MRLLIDITNHRRLTKCIGVSMKVSIKIDRQAILSQLEELGQEKQGPFILSRTLNILANEVQKNLRKDFETSLTLRRKGWVLQQVKINKEQRSTKARLTVTIEVTDQASFINPMEKGAEHLPINGKKFLVIPNSKSFGKRVIGKDDLLNIKNLGLTNSPHGLQGRQRTFVINSKATGTPLVMQRVANDAANSYRKGIKKSTGLRMLYTLIKMSKRPKKIHWYSTATQTVQEQFTNIAAEVMSKALKDSKK